LLELAEELKKSDYGQYLFRVAEKGWISWGRFYV
jgi:hypothetical protein